MQCILHIGTEKTGTTLIQNWLYANQEALSGQGVFLSEQLGKTNNRLISAYFQTDLDDWARRNHILNQVQKDAFFNGFEARFYQEIEKARAQHKICVISSEHCHSKLRSRDQIQRLRDFLYGCFDNIRIICYFREQSDMAISWYSTGVKLSVQTGLTNFLEQVAQPDNYYFNFKAIADNWSSVFGRENCIFKIYDRKLFSKGDIRRDFLATVKPTIKPVNLQFENQKGNESLSALQTIAFLEVNKNVPYWSPKGTGLNTLNARIKKILKGLTCLQGHTLQYQKKQLIKARFDKINREFFDQYFDGQYLFPSDENVKNVEPNYSMQDVATLLHEVLQSLLPLLATTSTFEDDDASVLRDIATKHEYQKPLSTHDAIKLLELAQRIRPNGARIQRKLQEYRHKVLDE